MLLTRGQYMMLNTINNTGNRTLHLFSNFLLIVSLLIDFKYTTKTNSNMKKLTNMRHVSIQISRKVM